MASQKSADSKTLEGREFHTEMVRGKNENLKRLVRAKIGVNEY